MKLNENREDCQSLYEKLAKYRDQLKKFWEEMKWKEASKVRKLKSQIRSRKLQDISRKKLQFESRTGQMQTDMLHHAQGKVMTRKQVDVIKQKITKHGGGNNSDSEDRAKRGASAARNRYE